MRSRTRGTAIGLDEGYALWARTYDAERTAPLPAIEEALVAGMLPDLSGALVADLACGTGRYGGIAIARGARRVVAIDRSAAMLAALAAKGIKASLARGDLCRLPFRTGSIDVAVCALAFGHVQDLAEAIGEAARVLRSGGTLVLSDFHADSARAGLARSFDSGGRTYVLPHHVHDAAEYRSAMRAAGIVAERIESASAASHPEAFAGRRRLKTTERDLPIVIAISGTKLA